MTKLTLATLVLIGVLSPARATDCGDALQDIFEGQTQGAVSLDAMMSGKCRLGHPAGSCAIPACDQEEWLAKAIRETDEAEAKRKHDAELTCLMWGQPACECLEELKKSPACAARRR